ncbi:pectate lyase [Viridibacterium curvum]
MIRRMMAVALFTGIASGAQAATDYPSGYTKCVQVGSSCTMTGTRSTALGKAGSFVYATKTGNFACDLSAYPTNTFTSTAWCSYSATTTSSSSVASSATSSAASSAASSATSSTAAGASSLCVAGGTIDGVEVDCGGKTLSLKGVDGFDGCSADKEGQPSVLSLKNGAIVKNVRIAAGGGGHGISCLAGNCTLRNVVWEEVCEHAAGNYSEGGTFSIYDSTAYQMLDNAYEHGSKPDKFFQDNAFNSKMYVRNFTAIMVQSDLTATTTKDKSGKSISLAKYTSSGKILRTCGDCSSNKGGRTIDLDGLTVKYQNAAGTRLSGPGISTIVGIDTTWDSTVPSPYNVPDKAILRNLKIQDYKSGTPTVCDAYVGTRTTDASTKLGEKWKSDTAQCDVTTADVSAL